MTAASKRKGGGRSYGRYAITCDRHRDGIIITLRRDKYGWYWMEQWQACRPEEENNLRVWKISGNGRAYVWP